MSKMKVEGLKFIFNAVGPVLCLLIHHVFIASLSMYPDAEKKKIHSKKKIMTNTFVSRMRLLHSK